MEVSKSIWRLLSFFLRNKRKVSVERTWEHNPRWLKRGAGEHPKSICHGKQQALWWILGHVPMLECIQLNGFHNLERCFYVWTTLVGLRYKLYEQRRLQNYGASPRSRSPRTTRLRAQRQKSIGSQSMLKWGNPWYARQMWNYGGGCATRDNCETRLQTLPRLLVEAVTRLFPFPFPLPDGFRFYWAEAQRFMSEKFLLRHTDHIGRLQCHDFKNLWSLEETTEGTLPVSNTNTNHNNQQSDHVCQWPFCTVHPEPS